MTSVLFDAPYWLVLLLASAGIALAYLGLNRRQNDRRNLGLALVGAAALLMVFRFTVQTDEKRVAKQARTLIEAVGRDDWKTAAPHLAHADLYGMAGDEIVERGKALYRLYGLTGVELNSLETKRQPNVISVVMSVTSHQTGGVVESVVSTWDLEYQKGPDGWELTKIVAVRFGFGNTVDPREFILRK